MPRNKVPTGQKIMYANPVCDYRPRKYDLYHVRPAIGGDKITYHSDSDSPDNNLSGAKVLFKCVITNPGSQFMCSFIKKYFLFSPMERSNIY